VTTATFIDGGSTAAYESTAGLSMCADALSRATGKVPASVMTLGLQSGSAIRGPLDDRAVLRICRQHGIDAIEATTMRHGICAVAIDAVDAATTVACRHCHSRTGMASDAAGIRIATRSAVIRSWNA
jgi:hypothetical protein